MKKKQDGNCLPSLVFADEKGMVYDVPGIVPVGMAAGHYFKLKVSDLVELPPDSELFLMPDRNPVGYNPGKAYSPCLPETLYRTRKAHVTR